MVFLSFLRPKTTSISINPSSADGHFLAGLFFAKSAGDRRDVSSTQRKHNGSDLGLENRSTAQRTRATISFYSPLTTHRPLLTIPAGGRPLTISFRIRTSAKHSHNPFRICTSKTQHLKSFRMNTYEKTLRGTSQSRRVYLSTEAGTNHFPTSVFLSTRILLTQKGILDFSTKGDFGADLLCRFLSCTAAHAKPAH